VIQRRWFAAGLALAACGGGGASSPPVRPEGSAAAAVQSFMQAVADSNLAKMATLWGSASGPASKTHQPSDYERRIIVMQAYLRNDDSRIASDTPQDNPSKHSVQVEIRRSACTWTVPFVAIRLNDGSWLVNQVDLATAGNPARPCAPSAAPSAAADTTAPR
jgi:hypothetical protein